MSGGYYVLGVSVPGVHVRGGLCPVKQNSHVGGQPNVRPHCEWVCILVEYRPKEMHVCIAVFFYFLI